MADDVEGCAHEACNCAKGADSDYCSAYCESAEGVTELKCECGHAACEM